MYAVAQPAYDAKGVLSAVTNAVGPVITSTTSRTTDGDGRLIGLSSGAGGSTSTAFTWDPSTPVPEVAVSSTGGADTKYLYGLGRVLALRAGHADAFARDAYDSVEARGSASDLAVAASYDEYGRPSSSGTTGLLDDLLGTADATARFGYRGELTTNGLVHLRARDYAPGQGRFTTTDPLDGAAGDVTVANPYPYAANDPLSRVDPQGLTPLRDADMRLHHGSGYPYFDLTNGGLQGGESNGWYQGATPR